MKHDHLELMESMSDIKIIQQTTNSKLDENNEMVRQMMKMMQEVRYPGLRILLYHLMTLPF